MPVSIAADETARQILINALGPVKGRIIYDYAQTRPLAEREGVYEHFARRIAIKAGHVVPPYYKTPPVGVVPFCQDPYYLAMGEELYPTLIPHLQAINSGSYVEAVCTGGIGSGKTTLALLTQAYQLYLLSLMPHPHEVFGLDRASEIEIIFQSITEKLAESVDYTRFRSMVERSLYFQQNFLHDKDRKSEMHFPNRIIVKPVSGSNLATIGQNVISGLIDELNYMSVVDQSRRAVDAGVYDQAVALYNSISRRRKSRFYKQGRLPGVLCLVSSKKYPGQFTDVKQKEAETDPTIYVYDKRVWDIKPDAFSATRFTVFIGDEYRKPRILDRDEIISDNDKPLLIEVPDDFRTDFERDIVDALREISGVSHLSKSPFFTNPDSVRKMFGDKKFPSIFSQDEVDFVRAKLEIIRGRIRQPQFPRFAHVDLGLTGDNCGLAIGYCPGFSRIDRGGGQAEIMPNIVFDGVLAIHPPKGGEILFYKVRRLFYVLRQLEFIVKWITYDSFQSLDSMQLLRMRGFMVGQQSMDKTMKPYDFFKSAIYDGRVLCPSHDLLYRELRDLQINHQDQKVDHLPGVGSKDVADACAGVVYGLTVMRDTWAFHGIPISEAVVDSVRKASKQQERGKDRHDKSTVAGDEAEEEI
jgi:hypothetical protein